MLPIWDIHQCHDFLHEGAPPHKSKLVKMLQDDREIRIWEWPGNFPYLNLIVWLFVGLFHIGNWNSWPSRAFFPGLSYVFVLV